LDLAGPSVPARRVTLPRSDPASTMENVD
jgi:hypothetical protein